MLLIGFWDSLDKGLLSLLMMISAIAVMVVLLRRHQFRHATGKDMTREQRASLRDQQRLRQSMDELLIQLEEVSRRVSAQVDTKFTDMEQIVRQADDRIARLERLLGKQSVEPPPASPPDSLEPASTPPSAFATTSDSVVSAVAPRAVRSRRTRQVPIERSTSADQAAPANTVPDTSPPVVRTLPANPRFQHVYDLIDSGHSPIQAAEALSLPLGEVELILNLRRYR